jgi:predicted amidophosphoribosyltransferase
MPYALTRHRRTKTQHELPKTRRQDNVRNAFKANKRFVSGKSVILIDDVCTSGATISACALALFEAGATSVTALTLAKVRLRE